MIKVIKKGDSITITGHSQPDVCASISSVMYTSVNMLAKYDKDCVVFEDNNELDFVAIDIKKHDEVIDLVVDNMMSMFEDIKEQSKTVEIFIF